LNTSGETKSGTYIAGVCKSLLAEIKEHAPSTAVSGFVMDSASANRTAMAELDKDAEVPPMVNLPCAAHTLSLLMKDIAKRFSWVEDLFSSVIFISSSINGSEKMRFLFERQCIQDGGACCTLASHCDTRFGSKYIVFSSVERRLDSLVVMVGSAPFLDLVREENETAVALHKMLLGSYGDRDGVVKRVPIVKKLYAPIMSVLTQVEADRASLSRMRALVRQLEAHAEWFNQTHGDLCADGVIRKGNTLARTVTMVEIFHSRIREFYYRPAMTAAFLLDPINFRMSDTGVIDLPFDALDDGEEDSAISDIERLAGKDSAIVIDELSDVKLSGFVGLSTLNEKVVRECMRVTEEELPDGTVKRTAAPVQKRMKCWLKVLSPNHPVLARVAAVYLLMHSTSCASERNLSVVGRLFDKLRGNLQLTRGEKMVYLAVNDRIEIGQLDTGVEELPFKDSDIEDADEAVSSSEHDL
jgi:hypothetical protein